MSSSLCTTLTNTHIHSFICNCVIESEKPSTITPHTQPNAHFVGKCDRQARMCAIASGNSYISMYTFYAGGHKTTSNRTGCTLTVAVKYVCNSRGNDTWPLLVASHCKWYMHLLDIVISWLQIPFWNDALQRSVRLFEWSLWSCA